MARLKPRKSSRHRADSHSGSDINADAQISNDVPSQPSPPQQDEVVDQQMQDAVHSYAANGLPYQSHQQQLTVTPVALPRARARKRKPSGPTAASTPESDDAAAGGRSSKRTRRGGSGGRGLYTEPDENDFNYDWASSESEEEEPDEGEGVTGPCNVVRWHPADTARAGQPRSGYDCT